jgi:hypothetical protein
MGCGCNKKRNVIRNSGSGTANGSNSAKNNVAEANKAARKDRLKKIKISATKRTAPKK